MPARPWNCFRDVVGCGQFRGVCAAAGASEARAANAFGREWSEVVSSGGLPICATPPALTTSASTYGSLSGVTYHPYSDFATGIIWGGFWRMGLCKVRRGADQFRTAPLWGVGQRLFFLHDGGRRTCWKRLSTTARAVRKRTPLIRNLKIAQPSQIQDLLNFLRSL